MMCTSNMQLLHKSPTLVENKQCGLLGPNSSANTCILNYAEAISPAAEKGLQKTKCPAVRKFPRIN